ncbi:MAG: ketosteroid isomerase-like protein [Maricaulis maris]|jgi:ketosteroid isomerase-like protein|uniref:SnoaL-like domain-containing protein n=1 Tax=Maricaulis maris (strain MCS10) TaxID=394221 RepID=Q0ALT6_MARMM|nr:nuclear transport factor 2 family protein [Maricaulis maris]ABI66757.1 hypothetical protein Mmar10_2466 [Maricaulis maris MCS10]
MADIRDITAAYVAAFDARDLDKVSRFFAEDFELTDPKVSALSPKRDVIAYIKELFDANDNLSFVAHRILADSNASVIHFTLTLGETVLDGVDLITWDGEQMTSMHAYLVPRS